MKYFYLLVVLLSSTYAFGQNYNNIVNYAASTAPVYGVKIKTNLPFTPASQMPTINITGYNFDTAQTINLTLVYYVYSVETDFYNPANYYFYNPSMSSAGGYTPKVFLSAENGKVIIFIDDKSYYQRFTVSAYAVGLSEVAASFEGWSAADEALTGVKTIEVPYKNSFKGDVNLPGNGIWNSNGDVGIGTANPTEKLTLNGNVKINGQGKGYLLEYASLSETKGGASTILGNNVMAGTSVNTIKKNYSVADQGSFVSLNYLNGITFHTGINGDLNTDIALGSSEKMRISQNGNIGIGIANPTEKLTVAGTIGTREIKVSTNAGADFVFEPDYQLPKLAELEKFVKANKHLPEIPTAQQMVKEGVNLGELNIKLLQKVEELTLHLIEKDKELNKQHKQVAELESKLKQQDTILKQILNKLNNE